MLCKKWVGEMKSPDGKQSFKVTLSYEPIWNGEVVKFSRSNPERKTFSEGYFYWDDNEKKIVFFSVSNRRGGAMNAYVFIEDGKITLKGVATIQNKTFDYKNTFEFTSDGRMIDKWFQNALGPWQPGHVIEFKKKINDEKQNKSQIYGNNKSAELVLRLGSIPDLPPLDRSAGIMRKNLEERSVHGQGTIHSGTDHRQVA